MQTDVSTLALGLYEALLDGRGLLPALRDVADRVGASGHAVHLVHHRAGRPVRSVSATQGGVGGAALEEYSRYWVRHDPWAQAVPRLSLGVWDMARAVPPEALRRSRLWNEWGKRNDAAFHAIGVPVLRSGEAIGSLAFHRRADEAAFDAGDLALMEALFPHLRRCFAAESGFANLRSVPEGGLRAALDALPDGVALLDAERHLVFANASLLGMVAQGDGLSLGQRGLDATDAAARPALGRAVTAGLAAADGKVGLLPLAGSLAVPRRSGGAPWTIRAIPVTARAAAGEAPGFRGAMLLVTDGEKRARPHAALLARLFGLTAAESALAASLAAGRTLEEHAKRRGVSRETVRTQLAGIRRKTGCRRQADLVALLSRLPG